MRRAAKVDGNHALIVEHFRARGCSVLSLAAMGKGVPDLLVAKQGVTWLVEVKQPKGKQNLQQEEWVEKWAGCWAVVKDEAGVENLVLIMQNQAARMAETDLKFSASV
jgi:Holliday junction resolvase